ncbi:hypothetical protein BpHYR1_023199 [Brachionus plicatilis]|uniref:Uncharacterized protein n=1 Tax=Brachionus plicatilis TaxID=10195 RepID=A0A3M7PTQ2_BRAPC|nr:hypothetical protein BpHYR1_023199 [Brachionus plicatilis]
MIPISGYKKIDCQKFGSSRLGDVNHISPHIMEQFLLLGLKMVQNLSDGERIFVWLKPLTFFELNLINYQIANFILNFSWISKRDVDNLFKEEIEHSLMMYFVRYVIGKASIRSKIDNCSDHKSSASIKFTHDYVYQIKSASKLNIKNKTSNIQYLFRNFLHNFFSVFIE